MESTLLEKLGTFKDPTGHFAHRAERLCIGGDVVSREYEPRFKLSRGDVSAPSSSMSPTTHPSTPLSAVRRPR